jgi:hypothetical protein
MEINAKFWASIEFTFLNNPLFLKLLFDIDEKQRDIKKAVFIHRVIQSDFKVFPRIFPLESSTTRSIFSNAIAFWVIAFPLPYSFAKGVTKIMVCS